MKPEAVREFGQRMESLEQEIAEYRPGETGQEELSSIDRFDDIWRRLDALTESKPHPHILAAMDSEGLMVTISRTEDTRVSQEMRHISVKWHYKARLLCMESVHASDSDNSNTRLRLSLLEESVSAAEELKQRSSTP